MYYNDVATFFERTSYVFQGSLDSLIYLNKTLPHRAEIQITCSSGSSLVVTGLDGTEPVEVAFSLVSGGVYTSNLLFTYLTSISSDDFFGEIQVVNHDGSPVVLTSQLVILPVAVSQVIPLRRTASLLRIDNEGANPSDFFSVSWTGDYGIDLDKDIWVELEKLGLRGMLQETTYLTNPSTGVCFYTGYVKISKDFD